MDYSSGMGSEAQSAYVNSEQRGAPRYTSLIRSAKLICGQGEFLCVVRDVSSTGISLRTFHALPTDPTLALELQNAERYEIRQTRAGDNEGSYRFEKPVAVERLIHETWNYPKRQLRLNLTIPLTLSTLTQSAEAVTLNISQQGARVECDSVFAVDQSVTVSGPAFPETRAKVRWRRDSNYGLVFENTFSLREFAIMAAAVQCPMMLEGS
ncbi:PilZ domain-containing protein [Qipengyuania psychrotolerans]|uniref:PilZ domain-containing protein n=1 Tax=Qipengyuania psychrotolerans TaxID=2867238 RepID=A0ABX8ZD89_9SPHN|nr:PilZ domain-containing protein [Qipengyuania psychrotolerans]QZD86955.1 PilZ domain-containing protein [Qipengyuania psychrotolerans]